MQAVDVVEQRWADVRESTGRNDGPDVAYFLRGDTGLAWCAAMLLRAIERAGEPLPPSSPEERRRFGRWAWYYPNRSVRTWETNLRAAGLLRTAAYVPRRNNLVFWRGRAGSDAGSGPLFRHVDIVTAVDHMDTGETFVHLIGGNLSNRVRRRVIEHSDPGVSGYGLIAVPPVERR